MGRPAVTAVAGDTLAEAAARMRRWRVGCLVVLDGDEVVGSITERDVSRHAASGRPPGDATVGAWADAHVVCVPPAMPVGEAAMLGRTEQRRHLPVVADGRLVGVVSLGDLLECAVDVRDPVAVRAVAGTGAEVLQDASLEARWARLSGHTGADVEAFLTEIDELRTAPPAIRTALDALGPGPVRPDLAVVVGLRSLAADPTGDPAAEARRAAALIPTLAARGRATPAAPIAGQPVAGTLAAALGAGPDHSVREAVDLALRALAAGASGADHAVCLVTEGGLSPPVAFAVELDLLAVRSGPAAALRRARSDDATLDDATETLTAHLRRGLDPVAALGHLLSASGVEEGTEPVLLLAARSTQWAVALSG